jgi:Circadian oscillating protein COP23
MVRKPLGQKLPVFGVTLLITQTIGIFANQPSYAGNNKFFCTQESGVPVTKVRTKRGDETFLRWVVQDFKKFPPLTRCRAVTARFQRYYDNGQVFITNRDNFQGYPVLCIANRKGTPCTKENILVTLQPGTDSGKALKQMLDFRRGERQSTYYL